MDLHIPSIQTTNHDQLAERLSWPCSTRTLRPGSEGSHEMACVNILAEVHLGMDVDDLSYPRASRRISSSSLLRIAGKYLDDMLYTTTVSIRAR